MFFMQLQSQWVYIRFSLYHLRDVSSLSLKCKNMPKSATSTSSLMTRRNDKLRIQWGISNAVKMLSFRDSSFLILCHPSLAVVWCQVLLPWIPLLFPLRMKLKMTFFVGCHLLSNLIRLPFCSSIQILSWKRVTSCLIRLLNWFT